MRKVHDNSIFRFVDTAVSMAEKATTKKELERFYGCGDKYSIFIAERMGTGAYCQDRYNSMFRLRLYLSNINIAVLKRLEELEG